MKRFDPIANADLSTRAEALRKKAWRSFGLALLAGVIAVACFGGLVCALLFSLLFQYNPLQSSLFVGFLTFSVPAILILIPTCWVLVFRAVRSLKQLQEAMLDAVRADGAEAVEISATIVSHEP